MSSLEKNIKNIYKSNVIQFPNGKKNKQACEHEKHIASLALTIQQKMEHEKFSQLPLLMEEISMLANYGETIKFSPLTQQRLISVLAETIIRNSISEELL